MIEESKEEMRKIIKKEITTLKKTQEKAQQKLVKLTERVDYIDADKINSTILEIERTKAAILMLYTIIGKHL